MRRKDGLSISIGVFLALMLLIVSPPRLPMAWAEAPSSIDLYTQKMPFDGKGANRSSDMFGPQEQVVLHALVLSVGTPLNGTLVTYEIDGPVGGFLELKFYQTARTNSSGIAQTVFSLATINETEAFGTWRVTATAKIAEKIYSDILTFEVDWLVELLSIRTMDGNRSERSSFGDGGYVGFEIALRDNAMSKKTVLLKIAIFDELRVAVNSSEINSLVIPPNRRVQYVYGKLFIPKFAVPGNATLTVAALDIENISYCPQATKNFLITPAGLVFPDFTDAFIYVEAAPSRTEPGQRVSVTTLVRNEGTTILNNVQVQVRANQSLIDSKVLISLGPYDMQSLTASWNTAGLSEGNYTIVAEVQVFPNEADLSDNNYSCTVELESTTPTAVHDIEALNVTSSENSVAQGETAHIQVVVRNNGGVSETTVVNVYFNDSLIGAKQVNELASLSERLLVLEWNTAGVPQGVYQITAFAEPVEGESNTANNLFRDGTIRIGGIPVGAVPDMAIIALTATPNVSENGNLVTIQATVANFGNAAENYRVVFFYDSIPITVTSMESLLPGVKLNITIVWNPTFVVEGNYTIKAYIPPLAGEMNVLNNLYLDGTVWIKNPIWLGSFSCFLVFACSIIMVVAALFLLILCHLGRRKRKRSRKSTYITIVYPHI